MSQLFTLPQQVRIDSAGTPYANAKAYFYRVNTTTAQAVYTTPALSVAHSQPVEANAAGQFPPIWLDTEADYAYRVIVKTSADVQLDDYPITPGAPSQSDIAEALWPQTDAELSAAVTPTDFAYPPGHVRRYGATGDGVTVDTISLQSAVTTGLKVFGESGDTYLTGPLTQSTARQVIDFTGCTVKRISSSTHSPIISLSAVSAKVIGGRFDGNKAGQSGTADNKYGHAAVALNANYTECRNIESVDSWGIGVRGGTGSYLKVRGNVCTDSDLYGVYLESITSDQNGWEITDNLVTSSGIAGGAGIYITGDNAFVYKPRYWKISGNTCIGSTSTPTAIGIVTRGEDGVCTGNVVYGYDMGISADVAIRSTFTGNRCSDASGTSGYGIELNGGYNTVSGNILSGGKVGIAISGTVIGQSYNVITGNFIHNPEDNGIYVNATTNPAQYLNITGNTIQLSGVDVGRHAITLTGDAQYAHISGNSLAGPGVAVTDCRGVFLDGVESHVSIVGNRFSGWERAVSLYNSGAMTYTDITFNNNDLTLDSSADPAAFLQLEGSATYGARIVQMWNNSADAVQTNYLDRAGPRILTWSGSGTPEAAVVATIGSLYLNTVGGSGTTLYVKDTGTGNTGWDAIT